MTADPDARSMRERMLSGDLYIADDPELSEQHLRAMDLMDAFNATSARDLGQRRRLLTDLLGAIGEGAEIRPPLWVDYGYHIRIGARTFANFGLVALDVAPITIGDNVVGQCRHRPAWGDDRREHCRRRRIGRPPRPAGQRRRRRQPGPRRAGHRPARPMNSSRRTIIHDYAPARPWKYDFMDG